MMEELEPKALHGYLQKRCSNFMRGWTRRYFVFERGIMKYYSNDACKDEDLRKTVDLFQYKLEDTHNNVIHLISKHKDSRDFILQSDDSSIDISEWRTQIKDHIDYSKENNRLSSVKSPKSEGSSDDYHNFDLSTS